MERVSERGHILCLPWRVCKVVKIMCKMSLNPLKHRFLSFFLVPPFLCCSFALLILLLLLLFASCWIISTASLFWNYGTIFIPFFTPFPSLLLLLSVLRRFSLNCFRCLRYLAPLFRLFCPPVIHLFLFWLFFPRFLPFFSLVFDVSQNNFCLLLFFALDFSFWV